MTKDLERPGNQPYKIIEGIDFSTNAFQFSIILVLN